MALGRQTKANTLHTLLLCVPKMINMTALAICRAYSTEYCSLLPVLRLIVWTTNQIAGQKQVKNPAANTNVSRRPNMPETLKLPAQKKL